MAKGKPGELIRKLNALAIHGQLFAHNKTVKRIGYALYCAGALVGVLIRSSFGNPLLIQLKSLLMPVVISLEASWMHVTALGMGAFANLAIFLRSVIVPLSGFWMYLTRLLGAAARGL